MQYSTPCQKRQGKRIQIKSAYKKSGNGQLLNLNPNEFRQLTPEALVDGNATTTTVAQNASGVNIRFVLEGEKPSP